MLDNLAQVCSICPVTRTLGPCGIIYALAKGRAYAWKIENCQHKQIGLENFLHFALVILQLCCSGPAETTIANPNSITTSVSGLNKVGNYVFVLTVGDAEGEKATDDVTIIVNESMYHDVSDCRCTAQKSPIKRGCL